MSRRTRTRLVRVALAGVTLAVLAYCQRPERGRAPAADGALPASIAVPARGGSGVLDVASWNIEWFGSRGNGPDDEFLQLARARDVIRGTDADVWGVVEVVDQAAWDRLEAELPGYRGFLASESSVTGGAASYHRSEQKVGLLYKADLATLEHARVILAEHDRAFAGRPPLEARLRLSARGRSETLVVIVLHMKAFADSASWRRRRDAGLALKGYLDATYPTEKVIVIGDWNDDVDTSILPGMATPFQPFVADPDYRFVTRALSAQGVSSTTGYAELIDHHLATSELAALRTEDPAEVYRLDDIIPRYAATTSDHYPVISRYRLPAP